MKEPVMLTKTHLWICKDGGSVKIGLTDFALKKMKSVVFLTLPEEGNALAIGEAFGDVESLKTVSDLISPVTGVVTEVNSGLADEPENIDSDPEKSWLIKATADKFSDELMTGEEYSRFTESE